MSVLYQEDLTSLSLQKLTMLKQGLDQEINIFQDSLQKLKIAQSKFQESGACLDKITSTREGKDFNPYCSQFDLQLSLHLLVKVLCITFNSSRYSKTDVVTGNEILVPLTGSMYVAGKLADTNNVLVDIGTGYYAQKSIPDAKDYFDRSVSYIKEQIDKIQQLTVDRSKVRDAAVDVIETKLHSQFQKEFAKRG